MRHAEHDVTDAFMARLLDQVFEQGDNALAPLQGEALLAEKFLVQEGFKQGRFLDFPVDLQPGLIRVAGPVAT